MCDFRRRARIPATPLAKVESIERVDVIRPGAFVTPTLAGLLVPHLVRLEAPDGKRNVLVQFRFLLHHRDGHRERVDFSEVLRNRDGNDIFVDGAPPQIGPRTMQVRWSQPAQESWLVGETPKFENVRDRLADFIEGRIWFPEGNRDVLALLLACYYM